MAPIRYAARQPDQVRNREVEATSSRIWSKAVTVVFETEPELIASVPVSYTHLSPWWWVFTSTRGASPTISSILAR